MNLYTLARVVNTATKPTPRRVKNIVVGRALSRSGFWSWLWR